MFLWCIAFRSVAFMNGIWSFLTHRCFRGAWESITDVTSCSWAHTISSTSSKISHMWKGTKFISLEYSSTLKCFMDLYLITRFPHLGACALEMIPVKLWKSLIPVSMFIDLQKLLGLFVRKTCGARHYILHIIDVTQITQYIIFEHITIYVAKENTDIGITNKFISKFRQVIQSTFITDFRWFVNIY